LPTGSAEYGRDAGDQFAGAERLWQVVIGAKFEAQDPIDFVPFRRKHQYRRADTISNLPKDIKTLLVRQHDIEHDQLMIAVDCAFYPVASRMYDGKSEALRFQVLLYQMAQVTVIVDHQETWVGSLCRVL
jgi:hypothetical protein